MLLWDIAKAYPVVTYGGPARFIHPEGDLRASAVNYAHDDSASSRPPHGG